ncbi:hypothetical protein EVAR_90765_1 [Eumeta japonica]|uniref:YqaJ viral recombinase domain-containing protein n=1 Tax=Eumeta variegata TaxID=151549 RepID=A0A4C1YJP9_EUMVA|nr:hypothetical protein EVAR_90765_1 [Eumeta japonica]
MESGFSKANSTNLPKIDAVMLGTFFATNSDFCSSEFRNVKTSMSSRASYGDDAISYVQLKRDAHLCTVKCKMCPEHKVHAKLYGCTLIIDEEDDVIVSVVCEDCVASRALIEKVKEETIEQSKSNLWFELRYITASKAYEVSRCKTADGTLVSLILGGKIPETKHMKRGRVLEDQVRRTVEDMLKKITKCGLVLSSHYPMIAGSPDGLCDGNIIEIKCPISAKTYKTIYTMASLQRDVMLRCSCKCT